MAQSLVGAACPLQTPCSRSWYEQTHAEGPLPEIRAYKLGKKRWSYNQVELVLGEAGGARHAGIQQAVPASTQFPDAHKDSAVAFTVELKSGIKLLVQIYLCYDEPELHPAAPANPAGADPEAGSNSGASSSGVAMAGSGSGVHRNVISNAGDADGSGATGSGALYSWELVTRHKCRRACAGPTLRSIQRFGRLGKRSWNDAVSTETAAAANGDNPASSMKDPRYMYLSLDEACTHVGASAFRLVAGIYNDSGTQLLTTAVSLPIRVLANNDVPTGAARIPLEAHLPADWEGWSAVEPTGSGSLGLSAGHDGNQQRRKLQVRPGTGGTSSQSDNSRSGELGMLLNGSQPPCMAMVQPQQQQQQQHPAQLQQAPYVQPKLEVAVAQLAGPATQAIPALGQQQQQAALPPPAALQQQQQEALSTAAALQQQLQLLLERQQQASQLAAVQRLLQQTVSVEQLAQTTSQVTQLIQLLQAAAGDMSGPGAGLGLPPPASWAPPQQQLQLPPSLGPAGPSLSALLGSLAAPPAANPTPPASAPQPQLPADIVDLLLSGGGAALLNLLGSAGQPATASQNLTSLVGGLAAEGFLPPPPPPPQAAPQLSALQQAILLAAGQGATNGLSIAGGLAASGPQQAPVLPPLPAPQPAALASCPPLPAPQPAALPSLPAMPTIQQPALAVGPPLGPPADAIQLLADLAAATTSVELG